MIGRTRINKRNNKTHNWGLLISLFFFFLNLAFFFLIRRTISSSHGVCPSGDSLPFPSHDQHLRQYQRCFYEPTPYITGPLETAQYLLSSDASFIRFGDAEMKLLTGRATYFQKVRVSLTEALTKVFTTTDAGYIIGIYDAFSGFPATKKQSGDWWTDKADFYRKFVREYGNFSHQYFAAWVSSFYTHTYQTYCGSMVPLLYSTLREIWRGKDLVILRGDNGMKYENDVYDTCRSQKVLYAPAKNAWDHYTELRDALMQEDPNALYILSIGPTSKLLAYELVKAGRRALDLGRLAKDYDFYLRQLDPDKYFFHD